MKKFLLSFLTIILAGAMVVALILPLASVQTKNKETGKDVSQYAQSITMMDFIQSIYANEEKKAEVISGTIETELSPFEIVTLKIKK